MFAGPGLRGGTAVAVAPAGRTGRLVGAIKLGGRPEWPLISGNAAGKLLAGETGGFEVILWT